MRLWPEGWRPSLRQGPNRADLRRDIGAGIVLTGLLIPAGMGYAEVAGLPAITGLHATIVALLVYALVGPSRVLIMGPDSSLAPIIAAAIAPLAIAGTDRAVAVAGLLSLLSGFALVIAGFLRLGLLADLLSKPIRIGYLNGIAATLVISQLPKLCGFSVDADGLVPTAGDFVRGVGDGRVDTTALALGGAALVTIILLRRMSPRVPGLLVAVVGTAVVVWLGNLDVSVVGSLPRGLPAPELGGLTWGDVSTLLPAALGIALIASADTTVLSRSLGGQGRGVVDESHEMASLGLVNVACGALGGFPVSASSSRTPVAIRSGAASQMAGVVGAALVAVVALLVPGATRFLPSSALAAVVIVAASALADPRDMWSLWRARRSEWALAVVSFLGVALAGVLWGIGVTVALSLVVFVIRSWRPHTAELVRVEQRKGYHDRSRHPDGARIPGLVIARFDAPLFFANAGAFSAFIRDLVRQQPEPPRWIILASEPITDIDTTAADELVDLDDELAAAGIQLVFAELKGPVKDRLADYGLRDRFSDDRLFPTIGRAVSTYVATTATRWEDWTDRS